MTPIWMMSNRQPWVEAVVQGIIPCKTRDATFIKAPAIVFLHASVATWSGWRGLGWARDWDMNNLPHGGVYGVARVTQVGKTNEIMPEAVKPYFQVHYNPMRGRETWNCAMWLTIMFENVTKLPFVACRGSQQPTKKLPPELQRAIEGVPEYREALNWLCESPNPT